MKRGSEGREGGGEGEHASVRMDVDVDVDVTLLQLYLAEERNEDELADERLVREVIVLDRQEVRLQSWRTSRV